MATKTIKYDPKDYQEVFKTTDKRTGEIIEEKLLKLKYRENHLHKCKLRTAIYFDAPIEHIEKAYELLNGKKLDGFYVNEMIDRFGFSNGRQLSRAQVSIKYGYENNLVPLKVANKKLKDIISNVDVAKAYIKYIKTMRDELEKDNNDKLFQGE